MSRAVGKHVKSKTPPPEVVGLVERPVKTHPQKTKTKRAATSLDMYPVYWTLLLN